MSSGCNGKYSTSTYHLTKTVEPTEMSTETDLDASLARASSSLKASAVVDTAKPKSAPKRASVIGMMAAAQAEANNPTVQAIEPVATQTLQLVQSQIDNLGSASKILTNALDGLAKTHPFISVAVLAFKTALQFEMTRRQNDKRVMLIQLKMNDMFSVLLILRDIVQDDRGPDGKTVEERLGGRMTKVANDIEKYSEICDTFSKKRTLVKLFRSLEWEGKLESFIKAFDDHKQALQEDLAIYSSVGIQQANTKLGTVSLHIQSTKDKASTLILLRLLRSPVERDLLREIELNGGAERILKDEGLMRKLIEKSGDKELQSEGKSLLRDPQAIIVRDIAREVNKSFSDMIQENEELFTRKFKAQQDVFRDEMSTIVSRESDRVIGVITSGPHDRIIDKDLYTVWRESGWKSVVKGRNLVLGLREYYAERHRAAASVEHEALKEISDIVSASHDPDLLKVQEIAKVTQGVNREAPVDEWALEFITISRIQPLLEAIDKDASSLVSVAEVNEFTKSRPRDWSLPKWLAYWSAGYALTLPHYFARIQLLLARIPVLAHEARVKFPGNNVIVDFLMNDIAPVYRLDQILAGVYMGLPERTEESYNLFDRFKDYVESEEIMIRKKLGSVKYLVDAEDTLRFVVGSARLEKNLLQLIYLLLLRAWHVLRHAKDVALHPQELMNISKSFSTIFDAACSRAEHLTAMYRLQNLDPDEQLQKFSYGIYYYCLYAEDTDIFNTSKYISAIYLRQKTRRIGIKPYILHDIGFLARHISTVTDILFDDEFDLVDETDPPEALLYPTQDLDLHIEVYDHSDVLQFSTTDGHSVPWTGNLSTRLYDGGYTRKHPVGIMYLTLPPAGENGSVTGSGVSMQGAVTITGTLQGPAISFDSKTALGLLRFTGTLNEARDIIEGTVFNVVSDPTDQAAETRDHASSPPSPNPEDNSEQPNEVGVSATQDDLKHVAARFELHVARTQFPYLDPTPEELASNKARALWRFAIANTLNRVRLKLGHFTWSYLKERRRIRRRFVELYSRVDTDSLPGMTPWLPELSAAEADELAGLASLCSKQDLEVYQRLSLLLRRRQSVHWGMECWGCKGNVVSKRYFCLDCVHIDSETKLPVSQGIESRTIDLCSDCIDYVDNLSMCHAHNASIKRQHLSSHSLFEIRVPTYKREEWDRILDVKSLLDKACASDDVTKTRSCFYCRDSLKTPYWYCVDCEETYVCFKCKTEKDDALAYEDEVSYASYAEAMSASRSPTASGVEEDSVDHDDEGDGQAVGPAEPSPGGSVVGDEQDNAPPENPPNDHEANHDEVHSFRHQFILYRHIPAPPKAESSDPAQDMFVKLNDRLERLETLVSQLVSAIQTTGKAVDGHATGAQ